MFWGAESFNQDLGNWNPTSATSMANMFKDATYFDQDLSGWTISGVNVQGQHVLRDPCTFPNQQGRDPQDILIQLNWPTTGRNS